MYNISTTKEVIYMASIVYQIDKKTGAKYAFESVSYWCIWRNPVAAFAAVSGHGAERVAGFLEV